MLTRSKLSKMLNVPKETIRYYETLGLINPKRDVNNGYRVYSEVDITKLDLIIRFKQFGFTLKDIKMFFDLVKDSETDKQSFNNFLTEKISDIDDKITGLLNVKLSLEKFKSREDMASCNVLSKFIDLD